MGHNGRLIMITVVVAEDVHPKLPLASRSPVEFLHTANAIRK
jgi:hypothetical protein